MKLNEDKDRGYSWVILAGSFLVYMLNIGSSKAFGILYAELMLIYDGGAGNTASLGSICTFLQAMSGPLANTLSMRYTFRRVVFVGGVLISIGFLLSSFTKSVQMMFLTHSIITGIGYGLSFVPSATIVNYYFDKYRGLANGIVVSASGLGGFLFVYLYNFLLNHFGLQGTLMVISGIMLNICVGASIYRQPGVFQRIHQNAKTENGLDNTTDKESSELKRKQKCSTLKKIFSFKWILFKNPIFVAYVLSFSLSVLSYGASFILLPIFITTKGQTKEDVVWILSITGIVEIFARIILGWFADLKIVASHTIYTGCMLISGISTLLLPIFHTFPFLCAYGVIVGSFLGIIYTLLPLLMLEIVVLEDLSSAYALVTMCGAVVGVIGHPCLGWLKDFTGSWDASFFLIGSILITSSFIMLIASYCLKSIKNSEKSKSNLDDLEVSAMLSGQKIDNHGDEEENTA